MMLVRRGRTREQAAGSWSLCLDKPPQDACRIRRQIRRTAAAVAPPKTAESSRCLLSQGGSTAFSLGCTQGSLQFEVSSGRGTRAAPPAVGKCLISHGPQSQFEPLYRILVRAFSTSLAGRVFGKAPTYWTRPQTWRSSGLASPRPGCAAFCDVPRASAWRAERVGR